MKGKKVTWVRKTKMWLIMTPLTILYLIILDMAYLINTVIIFPSILIINKVCCMEIDPDETSVTLQKLFNMNMNQMQGFRRLRQVSQINFESLPQLLL